MKTHAEFKRHLQANGTKLEIIALADGLQQSGRLRVGMVRFVNKANTVGVYLKENTEEKGMGSFLDYGNASEWEFNDFVATNKVIGYSYRVLLADLSQGV
jgi:hypothetical protein